MAGTPDLKELMRMAQEMQKSMKEAHEALILEEYTGEAGAGLVKVTINGKHQTKKVIIDPKVRDEDLNFLADLIAAAFNAASNAVEKASESKMMDLTKKLGASGASNTDDTDSR